MINMRQGVKCRKGKGIAVPYIIALILGIAVIAILGYWFFVLGGKIGGVGVTTECQAKEASYCQAWSAVNYNDNLKPLEPDWGTCTRIKNARDRETECKKLLGEPTR